MRSPAQHPSRLGSSGGLDLDLGLSSKPPPKKRARVPSHKSAPRVQSLPEPAARGAGRGTPSSGSGRAPASGAGRGAVSAAPALDLDLDHGKPASGPQAKRVVAGQGMLPGRAAPSAKVKQASIPPAPQSKPNPFRSTPSPESEAPPPQNAAEKAAASLGFGGGDDDDWDMAGDLAVGLDYGSEFPPPVSGPKAAPAGGQPSDPGPARPMMGSGAPASSRTSMPSLSGG